MEAPGTLGRDVADNSPSSEAAASSSACQECGNQAKKDCSFNRCRTCCKSRGFQCATHIKSTWVPAAKRRERQQQESEATGVVPLSGKKRSRGTIAPPALTALGFDVKTSDLQANGHCLQLHSLGGVGPKSPLPAEITAQTLLKRVRINGTVDGTYDFAYQAQVKIGNHIFRGVLQKSSDGLSDSGSPHAVPHHQDAPHALVRTTSHSAPLLDPGAFYSTAASLLLGGERGLANERANLLGSERMGLTHDRGSLLASGERGMLTSGERGMLTSGERGMLTSGERGMLTSGERGMLMNDRNSLLAGERGPLMGTGRGLPSGERVGLLSSERSLASTKDIDQSVALTLSAFTRAQSSLGL